MAITDIRVGEADFSLDEELTRVMRESPSAGGVASFVGLVRNKNDGSAVSRMTLEHYPGMTEKSLAKIAALPGDYEVYPGHMDCSTLETERRFNPYLTALQNRGQ